MHIFTPNLPSHTGCPITLSRVPCAIQPILCFKYSRLYVSIPNCTTIPSPHSSSHNHKLILEVCEYVSVL